MAKHMRYDSYNGDYLIEIISTQSTSEAIAFLQCNTYFITNAMIASDGIERRVAL